MLHEANNSLGLSHRTPSEFLDPDKLHQFDLWTYVILFLLQCICQVHFRAILYWNGGILASSYDGRSEKLSVDIFIYHILYSSHKLFLSDSHWKYTHLSQTTLPLKYTILFYLCKIQNQIRLILGETSQGSMVMRKKFKEALWGMRMFWNLPWTRIAQV